MNRQNWIFVAGALWGAGGGRLLADVAPLSTRAAWIVMALAVALLFCITFHEAWKNANKQRAEGK